jgi:hypothetical protein
MDGNVFSVFYVQWKTLEFLPPLHNPGLILRNPLEITYSFMEPLSHVQSSPNLEPAEEARRANILNFKGLSRIVLANHPPETD